MAMRLAPDSRLDELIVEENSRLDELQVETMLEQAPYTRLCVCGQYSKA